MWSTADQGSGHSVKLVLKHPALITRIDVRQRTASMGRAQKISVYFDDLTLPFPLALLNFEKMQTFYLNHTVHAKTITLKIDSVNILQF